MNTKGCFKKEKGKKWEVTDMGVFKKVWLLNNHPQSRAICRGLGRGRHELPLWLHLEAPIYFSIS